VPKAEIVYLLKQKTIVQYLEAMGIHPLKRSGSGRLTYLCPIPSHKDSRPSFFVWEDEEPQHFKCFGCGEGGTIIRLAQCMEGLTKDETVKQLAGDLSLNAQTMFELSKETFDKELSGSKHEKEFYRDLRSVSLSCRSYLQATANSIEEQGIIDRFFEEFDKEVDRFDFDAVASTAQHILDVLDRRYAKFRERETEEQMRKFADDG